MDKKFTSLVIAIGICIILIFLRYTLFAGLYKTDESIPGVTDSEDFIYIEHNSSVGVYILSENFTDEVAGINIESRSEIYGTNETGGEELFNKCHNILLGIGFEEDSIKKDERKGRYTGVFKNDTIKRIFHIFEGNNVEEHTGYYLILTIYERRL